MGMTADDYLSQLQALLPKGSGADTLPRSGRLRVAPQGPVFGEVIHAS